MPAVSTPKGEPRRALVGRFTTVLDDFATCLAWSRDGALLAVGDASGTLSIWNVTGELVHREKAHEGGVQAVAWGEAIVATGGADGHALLRRSDGAARVVLPAGATGARWVEHVVFSRLGDRVATASGRTARIWTSAGEPVLETEPHPSTVAGIAFGPSSDELATCSYGGVHLWRIRPDASARHLPWKGSLISLAWSPTGKVIATASQDCSVHFWRLARGQDSEMRGYPFKPRALAWDSQGKLLATSGDAQITIWDFGGKGPEGSTPIVLAAHRAQVTKLAFHPRRGLLASAAQDTGVIVWEPRRSVEPMRYGFLQDQPSGLAWSPDGLHLAAIDASGRIFVYRAPDVTASAP
jgi:WD40 repeat protein